MRIVFLGPPGAGKGTQAVRICRDRRIPHISTGNLLRDEIAKGTATGLMARAYMDRGLLVPDTLMMATVAAKLRDRSCRRGFLLDGFPRSLNQAIALDEHVKRKRMPLIDVVIHFRVPEEVVIRRLTG
ncbi:MAG: nucleoside monophosphate kinase, partial [Planctomycetota bacterium]